MGLEAKFYNYIMFPLTAIGMAYGMFALTKDAEKYKDVEDLKMEILSKSPKLYDSLKNDNVTRISYKDWQYEVDKMNASMKAEGLAKKAYFEGAQMVRDSIKNAVGIN